MIYQKVFLSGNTTSPEKINLGNSGLYEDTVINFSFGDGWDNVKNAIAIFVPDQETYEPAAINSDGNVQVPSVVIKTPTQNGKVFIEGYNNGEKIAKATLIFTIGDSSVVLSKNSLNITEEDYTRLLGIAQNAELLASEAKELANRNYSETKRYADEAAVFAQASYDSAERTEMISQQIAQTAGWFTVEGENGILYFIRSDNSPKDFMISDKGNGVLEVIYGYQG